jgi:uncharacterized membrane-anchored protein
MRALLETYVGKSPYKLLMTVLASVTIQMAWGDQLSLAPVLPSGAEPDWILGPAKADLGGFGTINIPEGYRFTDANGARVLLMRMRNPVNKNLLGLLAPDSGKWWVVVDYSDVGYLKGLNLEPRINANSVLEDIRTGLVRENALRAQQGGQPIAGVNWAMQPVLDARHYTLEWALKVETVISKVVNLQEETETNVVVNHSIRLIGKERVVGLTAVVQSADTASESVPLKELAHDITFNPGERYADYKAGDPLAKLTLGEIILGERTQTPLSPYEWAGVGVGGGVLLLGGVALAVFLVRRKFRKMKMSRAFPDYEEHSHALSSLFGNGKNGSRNGYRRRREFNYQKFYSDMMLEVSSGPFAPQPSPNGKRVPELARQAAPKVGNASEAVIVRANLELIASQNQLIEEQKRLLQEQAKLIEEKSKLIHEKTKFLEKQSELLERDLI